MSWSVFRNNIINFSNNTDAIRSTEQVASTYAIEYDAAIRRGSDILHQVSVLNTNLPALLQSFNLAMMKGLNTNSPAFSLINEIGTGIIAYWSGATLQPLPIPIIPAIGAIQNIAVVTNLVTNPGTWPVLPPITPMNNTSIFVDLFISAATTHLSTIGGLINTISLYPATPSPIPGPGILVWNGYSV